MSEPVSAQPPPARPAARSTGTRVLIALTLVGAAMFVGSLGVVAWLVSSGSGGDVKEGSFLEVTLSGEIPEAPMVGALVLEPDALPPLVTDLSWAIREAATDDRIAGLYLKIDNTAVGFASNQELRDAIGELRAAGKPCVAYAETFSTGQYYLASACDRIVMPPAGIGMVTGLAATVTYYAGTFEKIGVNAQMLHVGDFKSAVEPYQRSGPSEPASLAMDQMLDSLYGQLVSGIAAGRGRPEADVAAWIDTPAMSPARALERGMIDALAFPDQVRGHAAEAAEADWVERLAKPVELEPDDLDEKFTPLKEYLKRLRSEAPSSGDRLAVVYAAGPILSGESEGGLFGEQVLADRTFAKWMEEVREDEDVKAVVLRVDSPGGSALASDLMWREIQLTKAAGKPVVVSMANYAASGGYFISAPADYVYAQPGTLTGSIGVFGGKMDLSGTWGKLGMTQTTWKRGQQADLLSTSAPFSEGGREVYQAFLDDFYEVFLSRVAEGRSLTRDQVHPVAQGRVWTGEQAIGHHLVDELGGLDRALAKAAELGGIEGEYRLRRWPAQKGFVELLLEDLESASAPTVSLELPGVDPADLVDLLILDRVLDDGAAALLPGHLTVR